MISPSVPNRNVIPLKQKHFQHCGNKIRASANEAMLSMGARDGMLRGKRKLVNILWAQRFAPSILPSSRNLHVIRLIACNW
jgi:hypothetical protein